LLKKLTFIICHLNRKTGIKIRSYIKIYGPPTLKSIKALEKLAIDTPQVCIMDSLVAQSPSNLHTTGGVRDYFGADELSVERCNNIISDSGEALGEYDFFFEWFTDPSTDQLNDLIEKVDEGLSKLGSRYSITTK
jgi:hypothetical protein